MLMNLDDRCSIQEQLEAAKTSIQRFPNFTRKALYDLATFCYALGHERGYAEGHEDEKNGVDQRISNAHTN